MITCHMYTMKREKGRVRKKMYMGVRETFLKFRRDGRLRFCKSDRIMISWKEDQLDMFRESRKRFGQGIILLVDVLDGKVTILIGIGPHTIHEIPCKHQIFYP
jgi:hypothetical protein